MIRVNVYEVKARLSEYLDRAARGERIVICRHNNPVAELRPLSEGRVEPRPIGPLPGRPTFEIADAFFEPLSDDELALWDGLGARDAHVDALTARRPDPISLLPAKSPAGRTRGAPTRGRGARSRRHK